jgi:excinuclease ABC subunit C
MDQASITPPFDGAAFARSLPACPGVYRMLDPLGELLYVGKAIDLRRRVASYFQSRERPERLNIMLSRVASMDITITRTEAEALVLESRLIKTQHPRYNVALRDGKGYPYLHLSTNQPTPRLRIHRGRKLDSGEHFGPYPNREAAKAGFDAVMRGFKLRSCDDSFFRNRSRPCLQYQIGRCSAPCVGKISPEDYAQSVKEARDFLSGRSQVIIEELAMKMDAASEELDYEKAAALRDRVGLLRRVQARVDVETSIVARDAVACVVNHGAATVAVLSFREGHAENVQVFHPSLPYAMDSGEVLASFLGQFYLDHPIPIELIVDPVPENHEILAEALGELAGRKVPVRGADRGERSSQLAMAKRNADAARQLHRTSEQLFQARRQDLAKILDLPVPPERIECFDISHTMGEATVASCVVFGPEGPLKSAYRRYSINGITPGDDYAAMRQALTRRFGKAGPLPDLLLIDGGTGQLLQAEEVLAGYSISLPIVGVSKGPARKAGDENLILAHTGKTLHPGSSSPGLQLILYVRDEAHRFAIQGHRKKRDGARTQSILETIPGVGPAKRLALLRAFGGIQDLRRAGVDDLLKVDGINKVLAERIIETLRSG